MAEKQELNEEELQTINGGVNKKTKGKKNYFCQYCSNSYASRDELKKHIKDDHPGEPVVY